MLLRTLVFLVAALSFAAATHADITISGPGLAPSILNLDYLLEVDEVVNLDDLDDISEPTGPLFLQVWIDVPDVPAFVPRKVGEVYLGPLDEGYGYFDIALPVTLFIEDPAAYRFTVKVAAQDDLSTALASAVMGTLSSALVIPATVEGPDRFQVPDGLAGTVAVTGQWGFDTFFPGEVRMTVSRLENRSNTGSGTLVATLLAVTAVTDDWEVTGHVIGQALLRQANSALTSPVTVAAYSEYAMTAYAAADRRTIPAGSYPVVMLLSRDAAPDVVLDMVLFEDPYVQSAPISHTTSYSRTESGGAAGGLFAFLLASLALRRRRACR